jgi:hypothetical protein
MYGRYYRGDALGTSALLDQRPRGLQGSPPSTPRAETITRSRTYREPFKSAAASSRIRLL